MTIAEINALTLEDVAIQVISRLLKGQTYNISIDDTITNLFDQVIITGATKPTRTEADAEFLIYKQELLDAENARLAEVARMQDIRNRLAALSNQNDAHFAMNPNIPNAALWVKENILEAAPATAEANLAALEAADAAEKAKKDAVAYMALRKAEYPSIEELIVAMWENNTAEINRLETIRQQIKAKYPKPV